MKLIIVIFLATVLTVARAQSAVDEFTNGNLKFTANLYRQIVQKKPNENIVFSPFSIEVILALAREGAKGPTQQELTDGLHLPSKQKTGESLSKILRSFKSSSREDTLELLSANKIYVQDNFEILDQFKRIANSPAYQAGIEPVNFGSPDKAAQVINEWVEEQTKNKIKNLISPDSLDAATRLVLVNALYFSGKWETPFETHLTRKEPFYTSNTQHKEVDMMAVEDTFRYYESTKANAKFLELPYLGKGGNISMVIVLPNDKEGLPLLENNIEDVLSPIKELQYQRVAVKLPRFTIDTSLDLNPILKNLGITTMYSPVADFSNISREKLKVDQVVQKAFINVTESGTEAAAATAVIIGPGSRPRPPPPPGIRFVADHQFLYIIKSDGVVLFAGNIFSP